MSKYLGLYVDDDLHFRKPQQLVDMVWDRATNYKEAIKLISSNKYHVVDLDHDLGDFDEDGKEWTGYDVLKTIIEMKLNGHENTPDDVWVHTANPVRRKVMAEMIKQYWWDCYE